MSLDLIFGSVMDTTAGSVDALSYLICTVVSLVLGFLVALFYAYQQKPSKSLLFTIALLPAMVQLVIMLVNGNIGAGVAVMGAFSLVRFRSIPGNARDIAAIFLSMAIGLATGMGYLGIAVLFTLIMGSVMVLYRFVPLTQEDDRLMELKVTVPESLDYEEVFREVFMAHTSSHELIMVKTVDLGSLYQLRYRVSLHDDTTAKKFLDELRYRNGNLELVFGKKLFTKETI